MVDTSMTKLANWSLGLAILTALLIIIAAPLANTALPPLSYIVIAVYVGLQVTVVVLSILGLKSLNRGRSIGALVIVVLTFLVFEPFAFSGFLDNGVKQRLVEVERAVAPACSGQGNPNAAKYIPGPGKHLRVADFAQPNPPVSYIWVERASWPSSVNETQLVVCIGEEYSIHMANCGYTAGTNKERLWWGRDVRLVEAQTGKLVAEATVKGDDPGMCPDSVARGDESPIYGSHVYSKEIEAWLQQVLNP